MVNHCVLLNSLPHRGLPASIGAIHCRITSPRLLLCQVDFSPLIYVPRRAFIASIHQPKGGKRGKLSRRAASVRRSSAHLGWQKAPLNETGLKCEIFKPISICRRLFIHNRDLKTFESQTLGFRQSFAYKSRTRHGKWDKRHFLLDYCWTQIRPSGVVDASQFALTSYEVSTIHCHENGAIPIKMELN